MKEVVVVRDLMGLFTVKCALCNHEQFIDYTGNFYIKAKIHCDSCGAHLKMQSIAARPAINVINENNLKENDKTIMMTKKKEEGQTPPTTKVSPVQKLSIEKTNFYVGSVKCPFCLQNVFVGYNSIVPNLAQWCPHCDAELIVTMWSQKAVGGLLKKWYKKTKEQSSSYVDSDKT